jgi:hypothetical protein
MFSFIRSFLLVALALSASLLMAAPPTVEQAKTIRNEIDSMMAEFEQGNIKPLLDQPHPGLFDLVGGRQAFEAMTQSAVAQVMNAGLVFESSELGEPTDLYDAGEYQVCFVPRTSVIAVQGQRIKSIGFMIAVLQPDGQTWRYLDGSGLRQNPQLLGMLFPDLSNDVKLPPNTIEQL